MNPDGSTSVVPDDEFALDVRVVEDLAPAGALLMDTSDNCGSSCSGTACVSFTGDPS